MPKKLTFEFVKSKFKEKQCELLELDYVNSNTKMKYKCKNNHVTNIKYSDFKQGYGCIKCAGTEKLTFEFVKNYFKKHNCELLENEYINYSTKMRYLCKCGNKCEISFSNFKKGSRCIKCSGREKLTLDFVKKYFKDRECELLENEYINASTNMAYKCKCGNKSTIKWNNFYQGKRCMKCSGTEKLTLDFVKKYFKDHECELLENEYINASTNMAYKCKCGNLSNIRWYNFYQGKRCMKCSGNEKLTIDFVSNYFKEHGCKLLENTYINSYTKMKYVCKCCNLSSITWDSFLRGSTCVECGYEKQEKNSKRFKEYKLPSGKIIKIQGFEHLALNELLEKYNENDIITQRKYMPKIIYYFENKPRRYYPDIWIKSINKIIEVKSDYIYNIEIDKNHCKALATTQLSYEFDFWIYSNKFIKKVISF